MSKQRVVCGGGWVQHESELSWQRAQGGQGPAGLK